jgi:hypothetical protein
MKKVLLGILALCQLAASLAQETTGYFLPGDINYNKEIPTPDQFYHQALGEWHLTHDQVLNYMKEIARISDRAILYEYARSYENRPLVHLVFTSEENQGKLDELKELHLQFANPETSPSMEGVPLVVNLNYGVHGNESSATNSSVLTAYHLAAAEGEKMDSLLGATLIIVDPCLNPDGFTRHSTWANMNQGQMDWGDKNSRQFYEGWPSGRSNHYWFDLNRDYLLLVNPESRGRVAKFHEWKPNVVTDHHESSPNSTFFFQPGVQERINPLTPSGNHDLTFEISKFHARYFDDQASYYFSEEVFDDYYFGKGSSYPDINSGIGILFEQASYRGRIRETSNGVLTLAQAIKSQFTATRSTLEASMYLRTKLLNYQRDFYKSALELGEKSETIAYVFGSETDKVKTQRFIEFLNRHQIQVYANENDRSGYPYMVPVEQQQYRLLTSIFEEVSSFRDTAFYDVSTWTIPHAMDIPFARINSKGGLQISGEPVAAKQVEGKVIGGKSQLGYLFRWNEYSTPEALYALQESGLLARVAGSEFSFQIAGRQEDFIQGTILIRVGGQGLNEEEIFQRVSEIAVNTGLDFYALSTGLSPMGIDMGSSSFSNLEQPKILMFVDGSANVYLAGEIWHLFDQVYKVPVTRAQTDLLGSIDLNRYNSIILPGGSYQEWDPGEIGELRIWIEKGGTLITCKDASVWAAKQELGKNSLKKTVAADSTKYLKYDERGKESTLHQIGGAIVNAKLDVTHPLCYGYLDENLAILKKGTAVMEPSDIKYSEPVRFDSLPYISGWISEENLDRIKGAPVVSVYSEGRGKVISYHEDMNFRGIWLGTHKLFANSIFFGSVIR